MDEARKELLATQVQMRGDWAVVEVQGEVIEHTGGLLRRALTEAAGRAPRVAVDLRAVECMDSSGLGILIDTVRQARPGAIRFFGCSRRVRRLFELTGVDTLFDICTSEEEALAPAA